MKSLNLVFPNQLFQNSPIFENKEPIYLVEEYLFFKHYKFHKQKIAFHRATMKCYADYVIREKNITVTYIESGEKIADIRFLIPELKSKGYTHINYIDPTDNWLQKRLNKGLKEGGFTHKQYVSPLFFNSKDDLTSFFRLDKKKVQSNFFLY